MKPGIGTGAQEGNRTPDLRITSALLYRLSYLGRTLNFTERLASRHMRLCSQVPLRRLNASTRPTTNTTNPAGMVRIISHGIAPTVVVSSW